MTSKFVECVGSISHRVRAWEGDVWSVVVSFHGSDVYNSRGSGRSQIDIPIDSQIVGQNDKMHRLMIHLYNSITKTLGSTWELWYTHTVMCTLIYIYIIIYIYIYMMYVQNMTDSILTWLVCSPWHPEVFTPKIALVTTACSSICWPTWLISCDNSGHSSTVHSVVEQKP